MRFLVAAGIAVVVLAFVANFCSLYEILGKLVSWLVAVFYV